MLPNMLIFHISLSRVGRGGGGGSCRGSLMRGCLVLQLKAKLCGHSLVQLSVLTLVFSRCIGAVQWHLRGPSHAPSPLPALLPGGGGTLYNGLYGEAPPERGTFFRPQVYEKVGILLVEVYERVGKSVIWVCERA